MKSHKLLAVLAVVTLGLVASSSSPAKPMSLSEVSHIHGIAFDPANPGAIYLATHHGLFRAIPDGTVTLLSPDRSDYMGFTPDPADPGRLLASGHPEGGGNLGVILSRDGGSSWTQLSLGAGGPVDFHAMSISRADPRTVYGLFDGIQVSRDGGMTWLRAGAGPDRVIDLAASPVRADTLYAGSVGGLMLSSNAGATWALIGPVNVPTTMVEVTGDGSLYAFFAGAGLLKLAPDGTWGSLAASFGDSYILHIAADPESAAHLVAVTEASAIIESIDGGRTWEAFGP